MPEPHLPEKQRPLFERITNVTVDVRKLHPNGSTHHYGSGAVLSRCGLIITAAHVILRSRVVVVRRLWLDKKRWRIWTYGKYKADVIYRDHRTDIAILKLRKPPRDLEAIVLGESDAITVGSAVYRVGRDHIPLGAGYVVAITPHLRSMRMLNVGMDVHAAASGGPVCNEAGELIGICLERQDCDSLPPLACVLTMADIRRRVLRRKDVRKELEASSAT